jgi:cytidylate kinase
MHTLKQKAFNSEHPFKIALDGPAAVGKGTLGRILAREFKLLYVQSSAVYRALGFICIKENIDLKNLNNELNKIIHLSTQSLSIRRITENIDLTSEEIGKVASIVASISEVRHNLSESLKQIAHESGRLIMEGRDIGTVIMPQADLKLFITADTMVRANRRYKQLLEAGKECILNDVLNQIIERDLRDTSRAEAPLLHANDALIINTSELEPMQVVDKVRECILTSS